MCMHYEGLHNHMQTVLGAAELGLSSQEVGVKPAAKLHSSPMQTPAGRLQLHAQAFSPAVDSWYV